MARNQCQCPLGLMTHFYGVDGVYHYNAVHEVSMPSRADDSFLPVYEKIGTVCC